MDMYTFALSIAYTNKAIKAAELEGFKVQVETTRDILETVGEEKTFYFLPKVVSEPQNGYDEYIYVNDSWELMGSTDIDLSSYMTLAWDEPTEPAPSINYGQLYCDIEAHKAIIEGLIELYDTEYIDQQIDNCTKKLPLLVKMYYENNNLISSITTKQLIEYLYDQIRAELKVPVYLYIHNNLGDITNLQLDNIVGGTNTVFISAHTLNPTTGEIKRYSKTLNIQTDYFSLNYIGLGTIDTYSKTEIDSMIGDIETALSEV